MARITLPEGDFEEPYRLFMLAPAISGPAGAYSDAVYNKSTLSVRLRELLRIRIAQINQCVV